MMLGSKPFTKCNNFYFCPESKRLAVGDTVYYLSETMRYGIKRSKIRELKIKKGRFPLCLDSCNLLLVNGDKVDYNDTFNSKEDILEYLIEKIKLNIACRRRAISSELREIKFEERLQKMYEKRLRAGTDDN